MNKKKLILSSIALLFCSGLIYLYIWEKPKLEKVVENYVESLSHNKSIPLNIDIGHTNFSIIPLQIELYEAKLSPKNDLKKIISNLNIRKVVLRPSIIDLLVGKFWISLLSIEGTEIDIKISNISSKTNVESQNLDLNLDQFLKRIPLSQLNIQEVKLNLNYQDKYFATTQNLYLKAYNEKSSLILSVKDPDIGIKLHKEDKYFHFLTDFQVMITRNTISLSKIKIVKENSFFLASGNLLYKNSPENITEMNIKTRISSNFSSLKDWSNVLYKNSYFDKLKGEIKTDIDLIKKEKNKSLSSVINSEISNLQVGKVKLGNINASLKLPNDHQINIDEISANLPGNNRVVIDHGKIDVSEETSITANIEIKDAQLQTFLKHSGIADIPVWLKVGGQLKCDGLYKKSLKIDCPGALTVKKINIKNKSRTKSIIKADKVDVAGSMTITEKAITYSAKAKLNKSQGESTGTIDFDKGFDIKYESPFLDLAEIGPIADLKFLGHGTAKGSTQGDSDSAVFDIDMTAENFEFEDYFFGQVKSLLRYKSGKLYFDPIEGNLESTRFHGNLRVDLEKDMILGDIQLPFFRMSDIQQAILKKVNLQDRFLGSGSGRLQLDTPFEISQLNFNLNARLFKGKAFDEDYNEAKIKAQAVDGIIIIQEATLQKEKTRFLMRGTIDTELESQLSFVVNDGFLQLSSRLKQYNLPISGQFSAQGSIFGKLSDPNIKTKAKIEDLIFNKKKYGKALFSYDNSNKQTNLQFNIPEQMELLVLLPESNLDSIFIDFNASDLEIAPFIGFAVSEDSTRSYSITTSGELSGTFDTKNFWNSEFSSIVKNVKFEYKSNKLETTIPTNIELKNGKLFLNEIRLLGNRQHIKVNQSYADKYSTKFVINSRMNISFFKILAPFIEKIDGYSYLRLELTLNKNDVKLIGSLDTVDGFLKFPSFPHALENISASILFNQNKVSINSLSGDMAGGKVIGNGEVNLLGGKKIDLFINSNLENVNIKFPDGFNTTGSGTITLSGQETPFLLSGEYNVIGGVIDSNFDSGGTGKSTDLLEELLKKEITSPLLINLDINTRNPVEVRNKLVEGYILGNIKVFDKINAPRIKGEAHFDENAVIRFKDQEFEVTSSSFEFEGQSPINPKLSMRSQTRMNGYDIELFLQGRAAKPIFTWSSQPPLPETQIVSMLALGTLPNQNQQNTSTLALGTAPNQVQQNNSNPLAQQTGSTGATSNTNTQGFQVGTSLLSNNPIGKELKERLDVDVQFSSSFNDQTNTAVPKVTVRKKITKKLQMSVSATTGNSTQQEGKVTYELNNNLSTIMRIQNRPNNVNNTTNQNNYTNQYNPFGVDLEYKVEFD